MITWLLDPVQLSISSTRALCHKYAWLWSTDERYFFYIFFSESPPL